MIYLLETSTAATILIKLNDKCLIEDYSVTNSDSFSDELNIGSHNEILSKNFKSLLGDTNLTKNDLFILGTGPGSFTGLRIGTSFVEGLACGSSAPIKTVTSFYIFSILLSTISNKTIIYSDARREEYFVGLYQTEVFESNISSKCIEKEKIYSQEQFEKLQKDFSDYTPVNLDLAFINNSKIYLDSLKNKNISINFNFDSILKNPVEISNLELTYVRPVSARKISERGS